MTATFCGRIDFALFKSQEETGWLCLVLKALEKRITLGWAHFPLGLVFMR